MCMMSTQGLPPSPPSFQSNFFFFRSRSLECVWHSGSGVELYLFPSPSLNVPFHLQFLFLFSFSHFNMEREETKHLQQERERETGLLSPSFPKPPRAPVLLYKCKTSSSSSSIPFTAKKKEFIRPERREERDPD